MLLLRSPRVNSTTIYPRTFLFTPILEARITNPYLVKKLRKIKQNEVVIVG